MYNFTATFDETWFPYECPHCGREVRENLEGYAPNGYICSEHGLLTTAEVNPAEDPCERGGWVDPTNPAGSMDSDEPIIQTCDTMAAAVQFVQDFAFDVWDFTDGSDAEQDVRTGHYFRYYLHAPAVVLAVCEDLQEG